MKMEMNKEELEKLFDEWCEIEQERRDLKAWQYEYKNFKKGMKYVKKLIFGKFEVKDYDDLMKIIEENKLKGLACGNRGKISGFIDYIKSVKEDDENGVKEESNEEFDEDFDDEESEENNLENIRYDRKVDIKNNYIELIRNELCIVEDKLKNHGIGDEDLEDLHKVYVILRTIL